MKRGTGPRGCNRKGGATPAQLTGGAAALELRGGLIPAARSRTTPVREFLSPSLRPHKRDSVSAAATKLREPVAIYFFFRGFPSNLKRGHRHGLAQLRGGGAYRIPLMRPQARRQELSNWCCPWMCRGDNTPPQFQRRGAASKLGGCRPTFLRLHPLGPVPRFTFSISWFVRQEPFPKTVFLYGTQSSRTNQLIVYYYIYDI